VTNNSLPEAHSQPVEGDRLEIYHTGGCMAWRLTEPDAPGLFALVTDEGGIHIPTEPHTENLIIGLCNVELQDPLMMLEIDGRSGLCRWFVQNVGYDPDKEPDGPRPIRQLIEDVAIRMLLRCAGPDHAPAPRLAQS
jgi:hypothetical protein